MKLKLLMMLLLPVSSLFAQADVVASGGDAQGEGGTVSYTVGQSVYLTHGGDGGWISQGVQHQYEISMLDVSTPDSPDFKLSVYPNPTTNLLNLRSENLEGELRYELYNIGGTLLTGRGITSDETPIDMGNLPTTVYFLKVYANDKPVTTFKIIKK